VKHARLTDTLRDRASLYALGSLPDDDAREFGVHLESCTVCRDEVRAYGALTSDLALATEAVPPRAGLREKLLAAISRPTPPPGYAFVHEPEGTWTEIAPGVFRKVLARDPSNTPTAFFVRLAPGGRIPPHSHGRAEHCYVVEGELHIAGRDARVGDYHLADEGTSHDNAWSRDGCLLLIVESRV